MSSTHVLEVQKLRKEFGGIKALDGIDLDVRKGEILGLIGPNGAGKTALLNTITGFYRADTGSIRFLGQEVSRMPLYQIGRLGIGRTFQNIRLFKRISVLENVLVAAKQHATRPLRSLLGISRRDPARAAAEDLLEMLQIASKANLPASALSYGDARRLEIARALMGKPRLLLLDEPAAGMNDAETAQLITDIQLVKRNVDAIVLIEHDMSLIRKVSDRVVAMDYGRTIAQGSVKDVLSHPEVRRAYLGDA